MISITWGLIIFYNTVWKSLLQINTLHTSTINKAESMIPLNAITKGMLVQEKFHGEYNNLDNIQIVVGNFDRVNNAIICFSIKNLNTKQILIQQCQNDTNFVNDATYTLYFKLQKFSKTQNFEFNAYSPNATLTNSITVFATPNSSLYSQLYINGQRQPNNLYMIETYNMEYSLSRTLRMVYKDLYLKNPYILKGYYIYLLILLYPLSLMILIFIGELFLYNEKIINILITNIIIGTLIFVMSYSLSHIQNLNIACNLITQTCVS